MVTNDHLNGRNLCWEINPLPGLMNEASRSKVQILLGVRSDSAMKAGGPRFESQQVFVLKRPVVELPAC